MSYKTKKTDLFFEEAVMDDLSQNFDALEVPLSRGVFRFISLFAAAIGIIVFGRLLYLNVGRGDFYKSRAEANMSDVTIVQAERGIFYDRAGKSLVKNVPTFEVALKLSDFMKKSSGEKQEEIRSLSDILGISMEQIQQFINNIDLERQNSITLKRDLTIEEMAKIKNANFNDVLVENDFARQYSDDLGAFSHVLGYTGSVTKEDLNNDSELFLNDTIGKDGLEYFYNENLQGKNGEIVEYKNSKNESVGQDTSVNQTRGDDLYLTIDSDLQYFFYTELKNQIIKLGSAGGAGIIMNPNTGEILSLISYPSFDNNKITQSDISDSVRRPLFNRAVSGVYSPGSTIKPLVATAALTENLISPLKQILSVGYILVPNPYHPESPSKFLDWKPQGWVDMYSAIARSSDVYFYEVGGGYEDIKGLGITKLNAYWKKFGLGQKTGIDLPGEKFGFLPDPDEKEKRTGKPWLLGDTYNVSIGQGDLMVTPMEILSYVSSIETRGKFYQPFIVSKIEDGNGDTVKETKPNVTRDISYMSGAMDEVEKGMIETTQKSYGTAAMLKDLPFVVAGKTGSAQIQLNTKENAFFVGYGPVGGDPNKEIAVLILIEDARDGSLNTIPVANDLFKWYYDHRIR